MGNPDRFESISFSLTGGVQAKRAIEQVQVTIDQLQKLASALTEASLNDLALSGQIFVGMPTAEKFRLRDQIVERLKDIGVKSDGRLRAQHMWIYVNCSMIEQQIEGHITAVLHDADVQKEFSHLAESGGQYGLPPPDALKTWITAKDLRDPQVSGLL